MKNSVLSKIRQFVQSNGSSEDFSERIKQTDDYDVFYHLSDFRRSAVQWYPFRKDARILEVNAECGAITGALCDCASGVVSIAASEEEKNIISLRYKKRKNLTCICADELRAYEKGSFDYVVYIGGLESFYKEEGNFDGVVQRLSGLKAYLKSDGTFLLAAENRYGLDNWLGKKDSFTGMPFDAINNYLFGSSARSFTKKELEELIDMVGYKKHKFYYPLHNHKIATNIYTDAFLPKDNINERLENSYEDTATFVAGCKQVYVDVVQSANYAFFANSYIIEMTNADFLAPVQCVMSSYKRGRSKSFLIVVNDESVLKKCCFPEGLGYARHLCDEAAELRDKKIPVIDMTMTDDGFVMPLIKAPTLQSYIRELVAKQDCGHIVALLDKLWAYILRSSEHVDECAFDTGGINVGPILRKAFIEMIPLNCFYDNGDFLFFDQEFSKNNYPARYVMFRCIRNMYVMISKMNSALPFETCCARYDIDALQWNLFSSVDDGFLSDVNYYPICSKSIEPSVIQENQVILLNRHKTVPCDSSLMKKVFRVRTELMKWTLDFCERHNLVCFALYGTMLAAVQNERMSYFGDDAIDLCLKRNDYDSFIQAARQELPDNFFLQLPCNDEYFSGGYAKLRNTNTTAIEAKSWGNYACEGIGINIFPLDYGFKNGRKQKKKVAKVRFYQRLLMAKTYGKSFGRNNTFCKIFGELLPRRYLANKLDKWLVSCDASCPSAFGIYAKYERDGKYEKLSEEDFSDYIEMQYGGHSIKIPIGYDHFLKQRYGTHYMKGGGAQHENGLRDAFYAANVPYQNYQKRFFDIFKSGCLNKNIVLFGDGIMFSKYFGQHKSQHVPSALVHTSGECKKTRCNGINVVELQSYRPEKIDGIYPIICTAYIRETERIIRRMGFKDYYIFVDDVNVVCLKDPATAYADAMEDE